MSHQFQQQSPQGQPTDQYGQQPTQSMGGQQMGGQEPMAGNQQPMTGGQQGTQGMGGQQMRTQGMGGQRMQGRQSFEDHLTNELRIALEDFTELSHIADWCAKECAMEGLSTSAQITHDIAELAELNARLIARDSMFGPEVADVFIRVGTEGLRELQQYQQHPHITETMSAIDRTLDSCSTVLEMVGGGGQMMGGSQQMEGQQMGGQQMGGQQMGGSQMTGGGGQMMGGGQLTGGQQGTQGMSGQQMEPQGMTGGQQMGDRQMGGQR
ncbi:hypothetical protein [Natrinema sp. 74]|uniref:hypothetical protein n=1 Tax=Natrinema sp. 74 TaxID=3384159 RepID=UPI0038D370D6